MRNLNFGSFEKVVDGWVNTDITEHVFVARVPGAAALIRALGLMTAERYEQHRRGVFRQVRYVDLTKRFPFPDAHFDNAFSAHVLEHLYRQDAVHCLREVHRVLKPGGILRVTVPDLDKAVREYDPEQPEKLLDLVYNSDQKRDKNRHHWMYNEVSMGRLLREIGFRDVVRCGYRQGRCPDLDKVDNRPDETLFMEAVG